VRPPAKWVPTGVRRCQSGNESDLSMQKNESREIENESIIEGLVRFEEAQMMTPLKRDGSNDGVPSHAIHALSVTATNTAIENSGSEDANYSSLSSVSQVAAQLEDKAIKGCETGTAGDMAGHLSAPFPHLTSEHNTATLEAIVLAKVLHTTMSTTASSSSSTTLSKPSLESPSPPPPPFFSCSSSPSSSVLPLASTVSATRGYDKDGIAVTATAAAGAVPTAEMGTRAALPLIAMPSGAGGRFRVVRVLPEETLVLNSASRAPFMVLLEIIEDQDEEEEEAAESFHFDLNDEPTMSWFDKFVLTPPQRWNESISFRKYLQHIEQLQLKRTLRGVWGELWSEKQERCRDQR
jgi:hypothetical protein